MRIQNNIAALNTYRNLSSTTAKMQKTYEKLSSGYQINKASDDAAGLAISEKMRGQIGGLEQANENIQDGISLINAAENGLGQIQDPNLIRLRELAVQAANDTLTNEDRQLIQKEVDEIKQGIDDIANNTEFNTIPLLKQVGGVAGLTTNSPGINSISNKYIVAVDVSGNGSFDLKTNEGFPGTTNDDNKALIYHNGQSSRPSMLIEDTDGNTSALSLRFLTPSSPTKEVNGTFETVYNISNANGDNIEVKQIVKLKEEKFEFLYEITNKSNHDINVGLQFYMDTMLDRDDSAKFTINDTDINKSKIYKKNNDLPPKFGLYNSQGNPDLKAESIITGSDILVEPDELRLGSYINAENYSGFIEGQYIGDSGFSLIWKPATLPANTTKTVNTLYGLGVPPTLTEPEEKVWDNPNVEQQRIILQVGPNEGHELKIPLVDARSTTLGIDQLDMTTREGAEKAISVIDAANQYVSMSRATFGAYTNVLEHLQNNVGNYKEALTSAESRLRDADIAKQMTELQKQQVILQAAQSMSAQANQMSQGILELLK